jgi:hypothetical protein
VAVAQFGVFPLQKFDQRPIDVAEAEQAEVNSFHEGDGESIPHVFASSYGTAAYEATSRCHPAETRPEA